MYMHGDQKLAQCICECACVYANEGEKRGIGYENDKREREGELANTLGRQQQDLKGRAKRIRNFVAKGQKNTHAFARKTLLT